MGKAKYKKGKKIGKKRHVVGGLKDYKKSIKNRPRTLHPGGVHETDPDLVFADTHGGAAGSLEGQLWNASDKQSRQLLKILSAKPKSKCCRSKTRCTKCPVVIHKLQREISAGNVDREHLLQVVAQARVR